MGRGATSRGVRQQRRASGGCGVGAKVRHVGLAGRVRARQVELKEPCLRLWVADGRSEARHVEVKEHARRQKRLQKKERERGVMGVEMVVVQE